MEGAGTKGERGAHELGLTGKYRDNGIPGLVRFQLCLALGLLNIKHPRPFGESHMKGFCTNSLIIEVTAEQGRARLISIGFVIFYFVNNLHPAHASPFSF